MKQLNYFECAMIKALVVKFESGIIECSLVKIANEIGGITHETIRNYFNKFEKHGLLRIENKDLFTYLGKMRLMAFSEHKATLSKLPTEGNTKGADTSTLGAKQSSIVFSISMTKTAFCRLVPSCGRTDDFPVASA